METKKNSLYFPGLNGMRFFAAILVIITHIEQRKSEMGYHNIYKLPFINSLGGLAVTFFFVLSGFLITYLLFTEKEVEGAISVKNFYIRRILRIWPLYFLIVLSALFIFPHIPSFDIFNRNNRLYQDFLSKVIFFILLLPNYVFVFYPKVSYASHTWSIGVEEQFYLLWPVLLQKIKKPIKILLIIILAFWVGRISLSILVNVLLQTDIQHKIKQIYNFLFYTRIDCMAVGGVGAYLLFYKNGFMLKFVYNKYVQLITYLVTLILLSQGNSIRVFSHQIYSLLFCVIIINIATNPNSLIKIENKYLDYLGKISYGIYMYHPIAIGIIFVLMKSLFPLNDWNLLLLYPLTVLLVIFMAGVSYKYYEKWFLDLKPVYSKISSGNGTRQAPNI